MDIAEQLPIFDGHNDTLEMLYLPEESRKESFFDTGSRGQLDLPRARAGGFAGGLFAIFVPSKMRNRVRPGEDIAYTQGSYDIPMAPSVDFEFAHAVTEKGIAGLFRLEQASRGTIKIATTVEEIERCFRQGVLAVVLHMEGAEAIDQDLNALSLFHRAGLRSLGITWSRANAFGQGVPYRFPCSPDTGPGLTDAGIELVRACNELGILLDVSHLNEKGFWDVAKASDAPLVATHSGVHALCPSTRNLTDKQLDAIGASNGLVGINFHVAFLRCDGRLDEDTPIEEIVHHIDYVSDRIGIDHVAFGSDFDGASIPREMGDVTGLPKLVGALRNRGYDQAALRKITHANWLRVLGSTWKELQ